MSVQEKEWLTPEAYLALERKASCKSEYFAGEMFAMSGASRRTTSSLSTSGQNCARNSVIAPVKEIGNATRFREITNPYEFVISTACLV